MAQLPAQSLDRIRSLTDDDSIYRAFDAYPWTKDKKFLSGLSAILGEPDSQNLQGSPTDIATHARVFYYARRLGVQIDFSRYQVWLAQHPDHRPPQVVPQEYLARGADPAPALPWQQAATKTDLYVDRRDPSQSSTGAGGKSSYPMGFAEMLRLLQEGKPIPGIREIPNTVARDPSVKPVGSRTAPKKPWEKDNAPPPPETHLPKVLDTEFPPLDTEASESPSMVMHS